MIEYLEGTILSIAAGTATVLVGGVGYRVHIGSSWIATHHTQEKVSIWTHLAVKDDAFELYGFQTQQELQLFQKLLEVNGVGPKSALAVTNLGVEAVTTAIQHADTIAFSGIPRLGKKTAQKIIIELQSKLGSLEELELNNATDETRQLVDALAGLGYNKRAVLEAMKQLPKDVHGVENMMKAIMKKL